MKHSLSAGLLSPKVLSWFPAGSLPCRREQQAVCLRAKAGRRMSLKAVDADRMKSRPSQLKGSDLILSLRIRKRITSFH